MTTKHQWPGIVSADEYGVEQKVLIWAGLDEDWEKSCLADHIDFMRDIVGQAKHVEVEEKELDPGGPGDSGSWCVVTTDNETALRKDLRRLFNTAKRDYKAQAGQTKASLKAHKALVQKGPLGGRHLCTIDVWIGVSEDEYRYELASDGVLWLRMNGTWKDTGSRIDCSASPIEGVRVVRSAWGGGRLGPGETIRAGEGVSKQDLEAVWGN